MRALCMFMGMSFFVLLPVTAFTADKKFSPSFDCAKASNQVEKAICADRVLSELDVVMADRYKKALGAASDKKALKSSQRQWLKQREKCAKASDVFQCVQKSYRDRLSQL